MPDSEDDQIQDDPPVLPLWQEIQKRTFTNWVNLRLAPSFIIDLFIDMSDGLQLIKLIEVLTEKNLGRRNKRIEHVNQRLDNVAIALDFLQDKENINLTNIGPSDIVEKNPKLILGLMWILFRHYTIAKALPILPHEQGQKSNDKARLLQWIRNKLPPSFPICNLTSDWNDGFALAALVEGCVPGLKVDWKNWNPTTPLENTKKAMDLAHEHLSIDKVIAPEDLISSDVDEISVMAYLANFPLMVEAKKVRGYLNNVDRSPIVGIKSAFNVRIVDASHIPTVTITRNEDSQSVPVEMIPTNDPHVFDLSYVPQTSGPHEISLKVTTPDESIENRKPDATLKVDAVDGPGLKGLNPHPFVGETQNLKIYNSCAQDTVRIEIIGSDNSRLNVPLTWNNNTKEFEGVFIPQKAGHYSVNVLCNSHSIKGSPFPVRVQELPNPEFWGKGLCDTLRCNEPATIYAEYPKHVLPSDAQRFLKNASINVQAHNRDIPVKEEIKNNQKIFTYIPDKVCQYDVTTLFNDKEISKYVVNAQAPIGNSKAFGPGVESGMENQKAVFVIDGVDNDEIQFSVEGPAPSDLKRLDFDDNTAVVEYTPTAPGKYYVTVCDNKGNNVKNSPFTVNVNEQVQGFYPGKAKISDLPRVVKVNEVVQFIADTRPTHSLVREPELIVYDSNGEKTETRVQQKSDGTYRCSFCPRVVGHHKVFVTLDGVSIPPCPVFVACVDPEKILYSGPGINEPAPYPSPNQTHFVIDAKQAGPGNVEVEMIDNEDQKVDVEVLDEKDGSYTVKYRAPKPGAYKIKVVFAGFPLPNFEINVQKPADVSGTRIEGLDNVIDASKCIASGDGLSSATVGEIAEFTVNTSEAGPGELSFIVDGPNSSTAIVDYTPGNCNAVYTPTQPGIYNISILFGKDEDERQHIPGSPFSVAADYPHDSSKIVILDPNANEPIQRIAKGVTNSFIIDATKTAADQIQPELSNLTDNDLVVATELEPKIWKVDYQLNSPSGRRVPIDLKYGDESLSLGPLVEVVDYLPENLKLLGVISKSPDNLQRVIEIDPRDVGIYNKLTARIGKLDKCEELKPAEVIQQDDGICHVIVDPEESGSYGLHLYGDGRLINQQPIEFSTFKVGEAKNCKILSIPDEWILNKPNDILIEYSSDENKDKKLSVINNDNNQDLNVDILTFNGDKLLDNNNDSTKLAIVRLIPNKIKEYSLYMNLDEQKIKDSDITFIPKEESILSKSNSEELKLSKAYSFSLSQEDINNPISAFSIEPDKKILPLKVDPVDANRNVRVSGVFTKPGRHSIFLLSDGKLLPKHIRQEIVTKQIATAHGSGLEKAFVGEPAVFDIICPDRGQVKVNVKGPKGVKIEMEQKMENSCTVQWTPDVPGNYEIFIFLNKSEEPAAGSPYLVKVPSPPSSAENNKTSCFACAGASEVTFDCGKNISKENLTATVRAPDGKVSNCDVRVLGNNKVGISLKPKIVGDYKVVVLEKGQELPHSPFYVKINQNDLPNLSNVKIFGDGLYKAYTNVDNEFFIDTTKAGYGSVTVSINGPADVPMSCIRTKEKLLRINYKPPIIGNYQINVNFENNLVPDCPYNVTCTELLNTKNKKSINELPRMIDASKKAELHMYIPNVEYGKLQATVIDPNNHKSASTVDNLGKGYYSVQLKPVHFGRYFVHITNNGEDIHGSPFSFEAGQRQPSKADVVKVFGTGLTYGQAGILQSFMVDTSDAGSGVVNVIIDGPEPVRAKLKDLKDGRVSVEYVTYTSGHYFITVLFNGIPINDAPNCVYMAPNKAISSPKKKQPIIKTPPIVSSPKEVNKNVYFSQNENRSENISTTTLINDKSSKIPFARLMGRGIESGITGKHNEFEILPYRLTESNYSIEIFGPSRVDLKTDNTKDGISVKYIPYAPGDYIITVKNDGINIDDSPRKVKIEGKKLGGKGINESTVIYTKFISHKTTTVTRYGNGNHQQNENQSLTRIKRIDTTIENIKVDGLGVNSFTPGKAAMFRISNVGYQTLFVGVITAYGPCHQVSVNNCGQGSFLVSYTINDRTPGYIYIRYGNEDVPGTPLKTLPTFR